MSLAALAEKQHLLWILVENGKASIAVPFALSSAEVFSGKQVESQPDVDSYEPEAAFNVALSFLESHPDWAVIVSALKKDPGLLSLSELLPPRTQPADANDYDDLERLGLDLPFGDWACRDTAVLWVVK